MTEEHHVIDDDLRAAVDDTRTKIADLPAPTISALTLACLATQIDRYGATAVVGYLRQKADSLEAQIPKVVGSA